MSWAQVPSIIPAPLSSMASTGTLTLKPNAVVSFDAGDADARFAAQYLVDTVARTRGLKLKVVPGSAKAAVYFARRKGGAAESYDLTVSPTQARITAPEHAGLFYGAVSLWSLMTADGAKQGPVKLQAVKIVDEPAMPWRGIMLDSARHMQSIEFITKLVDWMALHKLNTLHWHLTDDQGWRLEIKRYPKLTSVGGYRTLASQQGLTDPTTGKAYVYGGFYTQAQVRVLVAYAAARNVTIVPEIEMPGHATAPLAAYPELRSDDAPVPAPSSKHGILPNLYNPSETTFTFLENVLTEVMELFPSTFIHVGGDEAIKDKWKASPVIQAQMKALGIKTEDEMQSYFIKRIDTFLTAHHRRTLGWDEILEGGLAPGAAVMSWRGMEGGINAARQGHDAILTPHNPLYFNYRQSDAAFEAPGRAAINSLAEVYRFDAAPAILTPDQRAHILGIQASLWTEYVTTEDRIEWMLFPRSAALAELGWLPAPKRDWNGFLERLPAELRRYERLGIRFAPTAFAVRSKEQLNGDATKVRVELFNQASVSTLRYTTDGSAVTATSAKYERPLELALPTHLRAAAFVESEVPRSALDRALNVETTHHRFSQEMTLCSPDPTIGMEQDPPVGNRPVTLANYHNACWIYKQADMQNVRAVSVDVIKLAYLFAERPSNLNLGVAHTKFGEVEVHEDTCTGALLASIPIDPSKPDANGILRMGSALPLHTGNHDLCFKIVRPQADPLWVLNAVQLQPR